MVVNSKLMFDLTLLKRCLMYILLKDKVSLQGQGFSPEILQTPRVCVYIIWM